MLWLHVHVLPIHYRICILPQTEKNSNNTGIVIIFEFFNADKYPRMHGAQHMWKHTGRAQSITLNGLGVWDRG